MHQSIGKKNKIIIYLLFLFILSTVSVKTLNSQKSYSSKINKIDIVGLSNSNNIDLANKLSYLFYKNIFFLQKEEINKTISKINIIEEYKIQKIYPSKLNIDIKPTKFIAKIYDSNELLVGSNGKLIANEKADKVLPYMNGKFDSKKFLRFKKIIDSSNFNFFEFKSIFFHPSNRWDVLTVNDVLIKLPENNLLESLDLADKIIKNVQFKNNKFIDLRINNYLIVK